MDGPEWLSTFKIIGGGIGFLLLGLLGVLQGKRSTTNEPRGTGEIVAATLIERSVIEALTLALNGLRPSVVRLCELLEAEAHRREVAAEVERELRNRGTI